MICHKSKKDVKARTKWKKLDRFMQAYEKQIWDVLGLKIQGYSHEKVTEITECPSDIIDMIMEGAMQHKEGRKLLKKEK